MDVINFYLASYGYPFALLLFLIAAIFAFHKTNQRAAIFMVIGFASTLVGHLLQNFGIAPPTYTEVGDALFEVPAWHAVGRTIGILGILLASASLLVFVRKTNQT
jgi:hypothetical protein